MPNYTQNYKLASFLYGESYSSFEDTRRFTIIDNQMAFISDLIGEGVIEGWNVLGYSSVSGGINRLYLSSGSGLIEKHFVRTFGDIDLPIVENSTSYVYVQRKKNFTAAFSGFSPNSSIMAHDSTTPSKPTGLNILDFDYNYIDINWYMNPEPDLSHYIVQRSVDGVVFTNLATSQINSFTDSSVGENTTYFYKIITVDFSGNQSVPSDAVNITTNFDLTVPNNPTIIMSLPGSLFCQIAWEPSTVGNVDHYRIELYLLDDDGIASTLIDTFVTTENDYIIDNLNVGEWYEARIYSVTVNGVDSVGIVKKIKTKENSGPNEVSLLSVTDLQNGTDSTGIILKIDWTWNSSEYFPSASKFLVYIIENGTYVSDAIEVFNNFSIDDFSVSISNYKISGVVRPILSRTSYIVKVLAVSEEGDQSAGIIKQITTSNFVAPAAPSGIVVTLKNNKNLLFTWKNSKSIFDHNVITITKENISTGAVTYIENDISYGKKTSYIISGPLDFNYRYTLYVKCFDLDSGLYSLQKHLSYDTPTAPTRSINAPTFQFSLSGDKQVYLGWKDYYFDTSAYFDIWRAEYKSDSGYTSSDFSLVDTIPSSFQFYTDHSVENGKKYIYFVTTRDIYGHKSQNPIDDDFITYQYLLSFPKKNETFSEITSLSVSQHGDYDVLLSWDQDITDNFDGWEIYKSINNKYSWEKIGSTEKNVTAYFDENALLVDGYAYYYMVRKFRNEARVITLFEQNQPVDSVPIARIDYFGGILEITDISTDIKKIIDTIQDFLEQELDKQHHLLSGSFNRRIDLRDNVIISGWTTTDNRIYSTTQDFSGSSSYIVYINGSISNIFYQIDVINKKIIFSEKTLSTNISLLCIGLSETSQILKNKRIQDDLSASLVQFDKLLKQQITGNDHSVRQDENLIPIMLTMITGDGYNFTLYQSPGESLGNCLTFYDIKDIFSPYGEKFCAATSKGIFYSEDSGESWNASYITDGVVHKIFYSINHSIYIALGNNKAYSSLDAIGWSEIPGFENVSAVRDISENITDIFITSDSGIYKIDVDNIIAEKINLVSDETNNCFGIYCDPIGTKIVLSTDKGVYESDDGYLWIKIDSFAEQSPLYCFVENNSYIFALSENGIFRSNNVIISLEQIGYIDADISRKLVVFDGRIIVSTDKGIKISDDNQDIFIDNDIAISKEIPGINTNKNKYDITSINQFGDYLFVGTDGIIFQTSDLNICEKIYDETSSETFIAPSIFVDDDRKSIGVYYSLINNSVFFDTRVNDSSYAGISNQYKMFRLKNGGWIDGNYNAAIDVKINGSLLESFDGLLISYISSAWSNISLPVMDYYTANYRRASSYIFDINDELSKLYLLTNSNSVETSAEIVSNIVSDYDKICKQFISTVKYYRETDINNLTYYIVDNFRIPIEQTSSFYQTSEMVSELPEVIIPILSTNSSSLNVEFIDTVIGLFIFSTNLNKYDNAAVTLNAGLISEVKYPHKYLEDSIFENVNSGLSSTLAESQQSNLVNAFIYIEKNIGDMDADHKISHTEDLGDFSIYQYDHLNSTVDYLLEKDFPAPITIDYITSVLYFNNKVLIGTNNQGAWSVDPITMDLNEIELFSYDNIENIVDIFLFGSSAYIISNYKIFKSEDLSIWEQLSVKNLSGKIYKVFLTENIYLAATSDGLYGSYSGTNSWNLLNDNFKNISSIFQLNYLFYLINDNKLYYGGKGRLESWSYRGDFKNIYFNMIDNFLSNSVVATSSGLRYGNATFFSSNAQLSLVDILGDINLSKEIGINYISVKDNELFVFSNNGKYYTTIDGVSFIEYNSNLPFITRALFVDDILWIFSDNTVKIGNNDPIRICKGVSV